MISEDNKTFSLTGKFCEQKRLPNNPSKFIVAILWNQQIKTIESVDSVIVTLFEDIIVAW